MKLKTMLYYISRRILIALLLINSLVFLFKWILGIQYSGIQIITNNAFLKQNVQSRPVNCTMLSRRANYKQYRQQVYQNFYRPLEKQSVNCSKLVAGDTSTITQTYFLMKTTKRSTRNIKQDVFTTNCSYFRRSRGYIDHALSDLELNFPLAFGMAVYKDIEQVERLLRAIYRPHNSYCFHVDKKSNPIFRQQISWTVSCFDNIYVTQESVDVVWGKISLLQAELLMMEEMLKHKKWKYYINLTGQEFPLKTNKELVTILQAMKGANIVQGTNERLFKSRWKMKVELPPHEITPVKGNLHVAVNRHFVDFCITDQRAKDFLQWLNGTMIPDESFFSTMNHNPRLNISGSFVGDLDEYTLKPYFVRYTNWMTRPCTGKRVRDICIMGTGDVFRAYADIGLFVNKFHLDFQYLGYDCLEEVLHEKTWQQYLDDEDIDVQYYTHLNYVKYKL